MSTSPLSYTFEAGNAGAHPPLVLLHGSYGTEVDLLPFAEKLAPGAPTLALRGTDVLDRGYAFFRRHPDRRVDESDIQLRLPAIANLLREFLRLGSFTMPPVVLGYSNGAIMGAALVATCPELLSGAIRLITDDGVGRAGASVPG